MSDLFGPSYESTWSPEDFNLGLSASPLHSTSLVCCFADAVLSDISSERILISRYPVVARLGRDSHGYLHQRFVGPRPNYGGRNEPEISDGSARPPHLAVVHQVVMVRACCKALLISASTSTREGRLFHTTPSAARSCKSPRPLIQ